jgi:hypothetical protein
MDNKAKKILVIGGNGYIGNRLVDYFVEQKFDITILDRNDHVNDKLLEFNKLYSEMTSSINYIKANYTRIADTFFKAFDSIVFLVNEFELVELCNLLNNLEPHQQFIFGKFCENDIQLHKLVSALHSSNYCCLDFGQLYGVSRNFKPEVDKITHIDHFCEAVTAVIVRNLFNGIFNFNNFQSIFNFKFSNVSEVQHSVILNTIVKNDLKNYKNCRVCQNLTTKFCNVGELPLDEYDIHDTSLYYCSDCFHIQSNGTGNAIENLCSEFKEFSYNLAIFSLTRLSYFNDHQSDFKETAQVKILIIGDGDNYTNYQKEAYNLIQTECGIQLCVNTCRLKDIDNLLISAAESFDVIICFDFDYIINLHETLTLLKILLNHDGLIFLQCQSNITSSPVGFFNGVNSRRSSYFSLNSMKKLCSDNELYLNNGFEVDDQYYVYEVTNRVFNRNIDDLLYKDIELGIYGDQYYKHFELRLKMFKNTLQNKLYEIKLSNKTLVGYGYNATLFNYCEIDEDLLDWIIPHELIPDTDIQLKTIDSIDGLNNLAIIIFSGFKIAQFDPNTSINPYI